MASTQAEKKLKPGFHKSQYLSLCYTTVKGSSAVADPVPLRMKLEGPPTVVGNDCSLY